MSNISKRRKEGSRAKIKSMGDHKEFLKRITKTLYYGELPSLPCLSLPVTEISCELWSVSQRGRSLRRLHGDAAAAIARGACVSPCALVLAILYLERLNSCNPHYLASTAPADLFLISLMVSNKFLQDDGEDDEVICSEWAAAGGIELTQLKKLEVEFLNAIDWNIFVNEKSFEAGLLWLERQVALKQAQLRGFFTYTDLVVTYDNAYITELVKSVSSACTMVALSYFTGLLTFVTSTLIISQTWLPALQLIVSRNLASTAVGSIDTNVLTDNLVHQITPFNGTMELPKLNYAYEKDPYVSEKLDCCNNWHRFNDNENKKNWNENVKNDPWILYDTWWSKTSVLNWLYQSALINPMQKWLNKIDEYAEMFKHKTEYVSMSTLQCDETIKHNSEPHCIRQWLNLSKLSALVVSMSDR